MEWMFISLLMVDVVFIWVYVLFVGGLYVNRWCHSLSQSNGSNEPFLINVRMGRWISSILSVFFCNFFLWLLCLNLPLPSHCSFPSFQCVCMFVSIFSRNQASSVMSRFTVLLMMIVLDDPSSFKQICNRCHHHIANDRGHYKCDHFKAYSSSLTCTQRWLNRESLVVPPCRIVLGALFRSYNIDRPKSAKCHSTHSFYFFFSFCSGDNFLRLICSSYKSLFNRLN